eukprot:2524797-Prymnesium_polylepis.2
MGGIGGGGIGGGSSAAAAAVAAVTDAPVAMQSVTRQGAGFAPSRHQAEPSHSHSRHQRGHMPVGTAAAKGRRRSAATKGRRRSAPNDDIQRVLRIALRPAVGVLLEASMPGSTLEERDEEGVDPRRNHRQTA